MQDAGLFGPLSQITDDHKRNILANNYARIHGIDIAATKAAIADDEFSQARRRDPLPEPWSTTARWPAIQLARAEEAATLVSA